MAIRQSPRLMESAGPKNSLPEVSCECESHSDAMHPIVKVIPPHSSDSQMRGPANMPASAVTTAPRCQIEHADKEIVAHINSPAGNCTPGVISRETGNDDPFSRRRGL